MKSPNIIAVFDSGLGSYSIVEKIRKACPLQDVVYLADRKSFPYGSKNEKELFNVTSEAISFLEENYEPRAIVLASNAPSVMVLPQLRNVHKTELFGVFPPIKEAFEQSNTKHIGILAVNSLINHPSIEKYISQQSSCHDNVHLINASEMVELVESGVFANNKELTQKAVSKFIGEVLEKNPLIDTFTLSSTHLPWLLSYFEQASSKHVFVDPADSVVASLPLGAGEGKTIALVTKSEAYGMGNFKATLKNLNIDICLEEVSCAERSFCRELG
jgi:glutamate racemase